MGAEAAAPENRAVGQDERSRGPVRQHRHGRARPATGRGAAEPPGRSDSVRPVAAMTAAQWRVGIDPAWRHLRTASVPTRARRAVASAPPSLSMIHSTLTAMAATLWEEISQCNRTVL